MKRIYNQPAIQIARIALESMILAGNTTPSPTPTPTAQMNVSGEGDPIEGR